MIKNYFKTALRSIFRNKIFSLINVFGLSIGIALFILIMLFVRHEYSYDKFNTNIDRIYRFEEGDAESVHLPSAMGLDAQDMFPEIEHVVRFKSWGTSVLTHDVTTFKVRNTMLADSTFFNVFTTEFIYGDPSTAFATPFSVVLTEKISKIFFGEKDPTGEILTNSRGDEVVVSAVIKDFPSFHLQIDVLLPFNLLGVFHGKERLRSYGTWQYQTYFMFPESSDVKNVELKLEEEFTQRWAEYLDEGQTINLTLRPLKDVYFADHTNADFGAVHGNRNTVRLFLAVGIFIILIACINFINLTTAKASNRAIEVGVRKVHGGFKGQLISQFLSESILLTFVSFLIAVTLVQVITPTYNNLIQKELSFVDIVNVQFFILSFFGILLVGLIAGLYPAFYLTAFNPVTVLKGEKTKGRSAVVFRRLLIILQFTISVALIICSITVQKQLTFLREKDMGFNKEHVVVLGINSKLYGHMESFKQQLLGHPEILNVSYSSGSIGYAANTESFDFNSDGNETSIQLHSVDPNFIELYEIELLEGRNFSFENPTDSNRKVILNEEAVRLGGLEMGSAAGTIFKRDGWYFTALPSKECEVIGVVKNFNFRSLHEPIGPQALVWNVNWHGAVNIKIQKTNISNSLAIIEEAFKEFSPDVPFEYNFEDELIDRMYRADQRLGRFFAYFSLIAIFIAVLGLFGLAAYIAESRTKEIGVRKVMGSTVSNIVLLLSKEFTKWVIISNAIAIPIAYYGMNKWLTTFAYKIRMTVDIFIIAAIISLIIAFATVSYQSLRAAHRNPADSLRYE